MSNLTKELEAVINCNSAERPSDTPDFILAAFLSDCLAAWNRATVAREAWYGRAPKPSDAVPPAACPEVIGKP